MMRINNWRKKKGKGFNKQCQGRKGNKTLENATHTKKPRKEEKRTEKNGGAKGCRNAET